MEHTTHNNPHNTRHITHNKLLRVTCYVLRDKGFSLLETLVAIAVITVGLVGVIGLIAYTISISRVSPNKVIAANLAQEGIEAVRNIRDSNWLDPANPDWDDEMDGTPAGKKYVLEFESNNPQDEYVLRFGGGGITIDSDECNIYYNNNDKVYIQDDNVDPNSPPVGWNDTLFNRLIEIKRVQMPPGPNYYLKVVSQVSWTDRSETPHTIILEDHLYDWKQ